MELFYAPEIKKITTLAQDESRHCTKVLRHRKGDIINLIDGKGSMYEAVILDADPRSTVVEIQKEHKDYGKVPYNLTIALPPLKNTARYEWFVEKATEIGITRIIPIITKYTERTSVKHERIQKILISAAKQSLHARIPDFDEIMDFDRVLSLPYEQKLIALCNADRPLTEIYQKDKNTLVMIGPEGGFAKEEINKALENGFVPVKIGSSRLRAETAGIVIASVICNLNLF